MVQVVIRVRPKNGYTYVNKVKTVTMESSTRLEDLLQRHGETSAASSHAALYLNGHELPLNTSIASHNLDDGVIIECCKSPGMSAAISGVLRDLDRVQKTIQAEGDRNKDTMKNLLDVPDEYLRGGEEHSEFWSTRKWNNDSLKNRKICLAIMKKILQRDERYSVNDLPHCTDCHSLHQNLQGVMPNRSLCLFSPSTKRDGKPSTVWILLNQKVMRQNEVAAKFQANLDANVGIDALEEFIRIDRLRHPEESDRTASGSPARRKRRNMPPTPNRDNVDNTFSSPSRTQNNLTSSESRNSTPRRRKPYCPQYASGPFAILCALLEAMEGTHHNSNGRRQLSLTEDSLKYLAQPRCRSNFYDRQIMRGSRSAFACMEGLVEKSLVRKEITMDRTEKWQLLPDGEAMARECLNFEKAVNSTLPTLAPGVSDEHLSGRNDILLVIDKREDDHFRQRLKTLCVDVNIRSEERELPAGDYLFVQDDNVLPIIIERKTWSDLADSVNSKGKARGRLDCVKIGSNVSRCERGNCQLCKMKRSGCRQVFFIIEGSRCRGRDAQRESDKKCTAQKRCQACSALIERHGSNITQEELEKVLHKLQAQGCFIIFTRTYNETIHSLFTIRDILKGKYFADSDKFARSIPSSRENDGPLLSYTQFCSNARSSGTPQLNLRKENGNILQWSSEYLASIIVNNGKEWKQIVEREVFGVATSKVPKRQRDNASPSQQENVQRKKRRQKQIKEAQICIDDSDNEDTVVELDDTQVVDLVALDNSKHGENNDDDVIELEEDNDDDVIVLEESQESIQILPSLSEKNSTRPAMSKMGGDIDDDDIIILDDPSHSNLVLRSSTKSSHRTNDGIDSINSSTATTNNDHASRPTLLIISGWEDYEDKLTADINRVWQKSYHEHQSSASASVANSVVNYKSDIQSLLKERYEIRQFSYFSRNHFNSVLIWMQIKHGIHIRTVPARINVTTELKDIWASAEVGPIGRSVNQMKSINSVKARTPTRAQMPPVHARNPMSLTEPVNNHARSSAQKPLPSPRAPHIPMRRKPAAAVNSIGIRTPTSQSSIPQKPPQHQSSDRSLAIEARLRRFGATASENPTRPTPSSTKASKPAAATDTSLINLPSHENEWICIQCTFANRENETVCGVCGFERKWICMRCEFHNNIGALECEFCSSTNPNRTDNLSRVAHNSSKYSEHRLIPPTSAHDSSTYAHHRPIPPTSSESIKSLRTIFSTTKRQITCGACGLPGHNRGNANAEICPSYNDEKERSLRAAKRQKALDKAQAEEQAYEESKREHENQQRREAELTRQMNETRLALERMAELQKADTENKRKKAESARRRANKFR